MNAPARIHPFTVMRADELPEMNRLQRSFYTRHYRPQFEAGTALNIDGQYGYPVVMLHDLLSRWDDDQPGAMAGMARIVDAYPRSSVRSEARQCLADMHYLREEWAEALNSTVGSSRSLVAFVGLTELLQPRAESWRIMTWGSPSITKAGLQNLDAVLDDLQAELDVFHDEHGVSLVGHFWRRLHADEPLSELAISLEEVVGPYYSVDRIAELIEYGRSLGRPYMMTAFAGFGSYERQIPAPWEWSNPFAFAGLFRAFFRQLFRASENRARESAGLPRVGEGLVSEIRLLRQLREAFPDERLDHQVRPWWLAPQSLDIVFRDRDIAIEYQGAQHSRPIEFFGGQTAFEKQQERDANKRWLCKAHGMQLIEVHPDYLLDDVVQEVRDTLGKTATTAAGDDNLKR
jgi:hypothetical protein